MTFDTVVGLAPVYFAISLIDTILFHLTSAEYTKITTFSTDPFYMFSKPFLILPFCYKVNQEETRLSTDIRKQKNRFFEKNQVLTLFIPKYLLV